MTKSMEEEINQLKKRKCCDHIIHMNLVDTFRQHFISNPKFDRDPADVKNDTFSFVKKNKKNLFKNEVSFFKSGGETMMQFWGVLSTRCQYLLIKVVEVFSTSYK